MIRRDFWAGKRILVTGHTGFKGSWLSLWLKMLGAELSGYALEPPSEPSLWHQLGLEGEIASRTSDIRDYPAVERAFAAARPQIVFHLAAQSLVRQSYEDPVSTYATNVMGTVHVLEAARRVPGTRVVVIVTSDKCYENRELGRGYREDDRMGGRDPYSSSKGCAELVTAAYRSSFFEGDGGTTAIASARAGNVIGGGDWAADRLVPDFMRSAVMGEPVRIRNPKSVRPWQHVLEPLHGYLLLAERLWQNGAALAGGWNFGPGDRDEVAAETVVSKLASLWGPPARWVQDPGRHFREAGFLKLDSGKARTVLGWNPRLDLDSALAWTVEWHKGHAAGTSARKLCLEQLERYQSVARP